MEVDGKILKRLEEWQQGGEALPEFVELYGQLLRLQVEVRARIPAPEPGLTQGEASDRLRQGMPLLEWHALFLDWSAFQDLFRAVVSATGEYYKATSEDVHSLRDIARDIPLLQEVTKAWYEGSPLSAFSQPHGVDPELLAAVIHSALRPFLTCWSEALIGLVDQEQWRRGYCPICGGKPHFAFLDKERGARWLLCSRCEDQWLFQRLECPYCGTQDQAALAYFTDDDGVYRLYVCERCRTYLKAIDLRRTQSETLLPLECVLTLDMDSQGRENGYRAGWTGTVSDG